MSLLLYSLDLFKDVRNYHFYLRKLIGFVSLKHATLEEEEMEINGKERTRSNEEIHHLPLRYRCSPPLKYIRMLELTDPVAGLVESPSQVSIESSLSP